MNESASPSSPTRISSFERLKAKYKNRELAGDYRQRFTLGGRKRSTGFILRALRKAIGAAPKTILDCPTGTGRFAIPLQQEGYLVTGGDYSTEMLGEAHRQRSAQGPRFFRGDIRQLPFPDQSFDVVICVRLFHLIQPEDRVIAMRELRRVAREKIVVVYYPRHTIKQLTRWVRWKLGLMKEPRTRYYPWQKIVEEIEAAGLKVEALYPACRWFIDDWIVVAR